MSIPVGNEQARRQAMQGVTLVSAAVNVVLSILQVSGGLLTQSHALLADGLHTLSDLLSDGLVWFAAKHATKGADEDHPYGHRRIETVATVALALVLGLVGLGIGYDALHRLMEASRLLSPAPLALLLAGLGVVAKEALFHYGMYVARKIRSNMLRANAWHHRSDVVSSLVVLIGIGGTFVGLPYLDSLAAMAVAVLIARMGGILGWQAIAELIDTGLDPERLAAIRTAIVAVDGVKALHLLRTRRMGDTALADVHIQVNPRLSVSEGHRISEAVAEHLVQSFDEISEVMVHIDPEDDEVRQPSRGLPLRGTFIGELRQHWGDLSGAGLVENVNLHYLGGRIDLELFLPLAAFADGTTAQAVAEDLLMASKGHPLVGEVVVYFR